MERNPSYSLRSFARSLDVSHTYLSLVMNGKRKVSRKRTLQFSQALQLDDQITDALLQNAAGSSEKQKLSQADEKVSFAILELDRFRMMSQWYYIAIMDLTLLERFESTPEWIAQELGISIPAVKNALERLERLNLIQQRNGRWTKTHSKMVVPTKNPEKAIREYHLQMIQKASAELEFGNAGEFERRDITGTTIAADPALLPEAKKRIAKFRRGLLKFLASGQRQKLYQLNVQLFSLSKQGEISK